MYSGRVVFRKFITGFVQIGGSTPTHTFPSWAVVLIAPVYRLVRSCRFVPLVCIFSRYAKVLKPFSAAYIQLLLLLAASLSINSLQYSISTYSYPGLSPLPSVCLSVCLSSQMTLGGLASDIVSTFRLTSTFRLCNHHNNFFGSVFHALKVVTLTFASQPTRDYQQNHHRRSCIGLCRLIFYHV